MKRKKPKQSIVSVQKCESYFLASLEKSLKKCLEPLGGIEAIVKKGDLVLLKPNVMGAYAPHEAANTHPHIVRAVAWLVKEAGAKPFVAEMAGLMPSFSTSLALEKSSIAKACEKEDIDCTSFEAGGFKKIPLNGKKLKHAFIAKDVFKADKIISLPKLKTHTEAVLSGAIKNSFAFVPMKTKKVAHQHPMKELSEYVVDVFSARKPDLCIMDAIDCMEGNGPARGKRKELGLLIASTDAVALDAVCSEIACLGKIPAVEEAARRRLGEANLEKIKIVGERLAKIKSSFEKPITVTHRAPRWLRKLFISLNYYDFAADKKLCDLCWKCLAFCPVGAIKKKSLPIVDKALCIECFHCIEACPKKAFKTRRAKRQRVIRAIRKIAKL